MLGLLTLRFFSTLMPLLLEWCHDLDGATQLKALQVLQQVVIHTWPRMPAHASFLWSQLQSIHVAEGGDSEVASDAQRTCNMQEEVKCHLESIAELLYLCGGLPFQQSVQEAMQAADGVNNCMLQAVAKCRTAQV